MQKTWNQFIPKLVPVIIFMFATVQQRQNVYIQSIQPSHSHSKPCAKAYHEISYTFKIIKPNNDLGIQ